MESNIIRFVCYSCGDAMNVAYENKELFYEKLNDYNTKLLQAFDDSLETLPEGFTFCLVCVKTKKKLYEQEIVYLDKVDEENAKHLKEYEARMSTPATSFEEKNDQEKTKLEGYEAEKALIKQEIESYGEQYKQVEEKIKTLLTDTEAFEDKHNMVVNKINEYENEILKLQRNIKLLTEKKEFYDQRIEFLQNFSVLTEVFRIKMHEDHSSINNLEIGVLSKKAEINWINNNAAFGSLMLLLSYFIKKNNIKLKDIEIFPFGNNSYFYNKTYDKKYKLIGAVDADNLDLFNQSLRYLINTIDQIKQFFSQYFEENGLEGEVKNELLKTNLKMDTAELMFKLDKKKLKEWTKSMKVVLLNFLTLIYYQEKKDEHEFLEN